MVVHIAGMKLDADISGQRKILPEMTDHPEQSGHVDGRSPPADIQGNEIASFEPGGVKIDFFMDGSLVLPEPFLVVFNPVVRAKGTEISAEWNMKIKTGPGEIFRKSGFDRLHAKPAPPPCDHSLKKGFPEGSGRHHDSFRPSATIFQDCCIPGLNPPIRPSIRGIMKGTERP
jgi:hypothetical protein